MSNNRYAWLAQDEFSASDVLGGARGIAEAVVPGLVFLGCYLVSGVLLSSAIASALCSVLFAIIRLAVQVPLWLNEQVAWLSAMKIALGIPLFIPVAWLTWWLLKDDFRLHSAHSDSAQDAEKD